VYDDTYYNDGQIGVWKQARLSVWKPNRCSAKNKNILKSLVAVIHQKINVVLPAIAKMLCTPGPTKCLDREWCQHQYTFCNFAARCLALRLGTTTALKHARR